MVKLSKNQMHIDLKRWIDDSYDIEFGEGMFGDISEYLGKYPNGTKFAIVTDSNVGPLYADSLEEALDGHSVHRFISEAGEENKTMDTCMRIIGEMSQLKYGRDSVILALGGGVVGDMTGFIAGIFNRGIPYIQIPTTVLAQADSSIGGKTAVDTDHGKNLVGVFKQPEKVYIDINLLSTLSDRDYRSGLAETIKHAIIQDDAFFRYLGENIDPILWRNPKNLMYIAKKNCEIKGTVVEIDPNESGLRKILNYGHTVGHAIEKISVECSKDYLLHGEAVSIGMMVAGKIASRLGFFDESELTVQEKLLKSFYLPTKVPEYISDDEIIDVTTRDKKAIAGEAKYVLPLFIGDMHYFDGSYSTYVDNDIVKDALQSTR